MVTLSICVGSSCHLKGSPEVIERCREEIRKRHWEEKVELKAAFCLSCCSHDGVAVRVGGSYLLGLHFGLGAIGVWIAMVADWVVRLFCFVLRARKKLWLEHP